MSSSSSSDIEKTLDFRLVPLQTSSTGQARTEYRVLGYINEDADLIRVGSSDPPYPVYIIPRSLWDSSRRLTREEVEGSQGGTSTRSSGDQLSGSKRPSEQEDEGSGKKQRYDERPKSDYEKREGRALALSLVGRQGFLSPKEVSTLAQTNPIILSSIGTLLKSEGMKFKDNRDELISAFNEFDVKTVGLITQIPRSKTPRLFDKFLTKFLDWDPSESDMLNFLDKLKLYNFYDRFYTMISLLLDKFNQREFNREERLKVFFKFSFHLFDSVYFSQRQSMKLLRLFHEKNGLDQRVFSYLLPYTEVIPDRYIRRANLGNHIDNLCEPFDYLLHHGYDFNTVSPEITYSGRLPVLMEIIYIVLLCKFSYPHPHDERPIEFLNFLLDRGLDLNTRFDYVAMGLQDEVAPEFRALNNVLRKFSYDSENYRRRFKQFLVSFLLEHGAVVVLEDTQLPDLPQEVIDLLLRRYQQQQAETAGGGGAPQGQGGAPQGQGGAPQGQGGAPQGQGGAPQ
jgi:hypothetical protein